MSRLNAPLLAFNRGEVSRIALARVDLAKLQLAAEAQVNFMPFVIGPMMLRPGFGYVGETLNDNPACLIDFVYSKTDTGLLELTDSNLRVYISDALISRVSVATAVQDPTFTGSGGWSTADTTAGCTATVAGGATLLAAARGGIARVKQTLAIAGGDIGKEHALRIVVADGPVTVRVGSAAGLSDWLGNAQLDTGTHSVVFTPAGASAFLQIESTDTWTKTVTSCGIEGPGVLTVPTPWAAATLSSLRWTQSGDIVYVAQYGGQQYMIQRRGTRPGARGWSTVQYRPVNGPFFDGPTIEANFTPSVYEGNGSLTSDQPFFTANHVGALFQLFSQGQTNKTVLGALGAFTDPIRVSGIGNDRKFGWIVAGTWTGTLTLQRSLVGPDESFSTVGTVTSNGTTAQDDSGTLNNVIAWYRVGFVNAGDYGSGAATVSFGNTAGGGMATSSTGAACDSGGRYGVVRVTGFTSATQVSIEVLSALSSLKPTQNWQEGVWSAQQGWPTCPAFQEGRLWWFSGGAFPIAGSQSNDYAGFAAFDVDGNDLGDSGVILESFGEGPSDRINWGLPLERLLCGRESSIASIRSSSFDAPLTPTDFAVKDCSQQGAARLAAVKIGTRGVFVQESGQRVYALEFASQMLNYADRDLTRLNIDIGSAGFVDIARAMQPDTVIYLPRGDGVMACLLFDPNDEVEAWWRILTLGVIENVRVLPNNAGGADHFVYAVVRRTVNGLTKRLIEKLAQRANCTGSLLNQQLDCALTYQGGPSATITLAHLPNTSVMLWADGVAMGPVTTDGSGIATLPNGATASNIVAGLAGSMQTATAPANTTISSFTGLSAFNGLPAEVFADQQPSGRMVKVGTRTVSGGTITLPANWQASVIVAFFGYMAPFQSAKLAYAANQGSPLTQKKKIDHVGLVMFDAHAQGLQYGQRFDRMDPLPLYEEGAAVSASTVWKEYDEPMIEVPGEWDTDARLCLLAQAPYPCKVGGVVVAVTTSEK